MGWEQGIMICIDLFNGKIGVNGGAQVQVAEVRF